MNKAFRFLTFLERTISTIWKDEKIQSRTKVMCFAIPLVLTILLIFIHRLFYANITSVPYVCLFCIVLLSASYGGGICALSATFITFIGAVIYHFIGIPLDIATLFLYLAGALFLTALFHFFVQQQQQQDILLTKTYETNKELVRLEESQEDFVNMAAHELKSPVTVLKAYIQLVSLKKNKSDLTESFLVIAEKMDIQLDKLLNIISDLQDVTKIKSGVLTCYMNDFNINESLHNCIDGIMATHPEVIVEYDLITPDPIIKGDRDRIEQVITNFIGNGLKYSTKEKYLKISCMVKGGWIKVTVTDHGLGIPAEKQPYVFERFFRVNTQHTGSLPGLGLGLFICKEIIRQHKGEIGVVSEEGKGSEFWFCLPIES